MKALHYQDSTKYALNIKNLFYIIQKEWLDLQKKIKANTTRLSINRWIIMSQTEKRANFSDLKGEDMNGRGHNSFRKSHSFKQRVGVLMHVREVPLLRDMYCYIYFRRQ